MLKPNGTFDQWHNQPLPSKQLTKAQRLKAVARERALKNLFSTGAGVGIVASALVSVFTVPSVTWSEAMAAITFGCGLVFFKDKWLKIPQ